MRLRNLFFRMWHIVFLIVLTIQLSACGYLLHPERRGQRPVGRIDPTIAVLDALGLLLFVVPGVIAFAVDITNGTLYFPPRRRHASISNGAERMAVIRVNPAGLNGKMIQELVEKHTGIFIRPDMRNVKVYELDRSENIEARLVEIGRSGYRED